MVARTSPTPTTMILTVIFVLTFLVALNFILLVFSCNKTVKKEKISKSKALHSTSNTIPASKKLPPHPLAPTGS